MRVPLVLALLAAPLVGCVAPESPAATSLASLDPAAIAVPEGAELVAEEGRALLRFLDVSLPFEQEITIPAGATIVRAVGRIGEDAPLAASMANTETGRRRCNVDRLDAWDLPVTKVSVCSGLAAIDPPGASWTVRLFAPASIETGTVEVVFETTPLDGIVGTLDLSQLSMPTHELEETQYMEVPSFDGTPLWVEVTLPKGPGPWPTVLASSPYNTQHGRGETPAMWTYFTHDWAKRGYAVVNADVRGFGMSGGCVEIWSVNEQKDQAFLVDWVAKQEWSDGSVGFYGQSYVGTTPVEAAVQAPEALKAIIAVAPVMNAYYDWHYGGVPNGESTGSPQAYQIYTDPFPLDPFDPLATDPEAFMDPATVLLNKAKGVCDPAIIARANDPRAVYDAFYVER
ncbi:MAG TPA: CocE/NonD family hydrolase, partial [Candidatus Thermoplasmatota archaeon]|nr:CocE/NonD family hydrolase [Candidatus Thermoplasmatota archaeon]